MYVNTREIGTSGTDIHSGRLSSFGPLGSFEPLEKFKLLGSIRAVRFFQAARFIRVLSSARKPGFSLVRISNYPNIQVLEQPYSGGVGVSFEDFSMLKKSCNSIYRFKGINNERYYIVTFFLTVRTVWKK